MKKLFETLKKNMEMGKASVLVTVIAASGSVPRGAGSRMLVLEDGSQMGTIGGGAVEYRAALEALEALKQKKSYTKGFSLTRNQIADIGMVCGGGVTVFFQYVSPEDEDMKDLCHWILDALDRDEDSWLVLDITDNTCWKMGLYGEQKNHGITLPESLIRDLKPGKPQQKETEGKQYYIEPLVRAGSVYIFGGGHVAQELVPVLARVGFRCIVMDDRKEFANSKVFPQAEKTIVGDLEDISRYVSIKRRDYVCIMTRGHQFDYYIQKQVLPLKPCYIGIMGSRNKIRTVTEKLLEDGFSREEIERCHMPVGTAIHAETPAEIAVSIAGEMIAVRAEQRDGNTFSIKNGDGSRLI